jgi:transposase-like protein
MSGVPSKPFPCPFCKAARVRLIGQSGTFQYYACGDCAEVWTALRVPDRAAPPRPTPPKPVTAH